MKKILFSISLMMLMASNVSAQLEIQTNGKVTICSNNSLTPAKLVVGNDPTPLTTKNADISIFSASVAKDMALNSYGVIGRAKALNELMPNESQCIAIGVMGAADNSSSGYSYGVSGILNNSTRGAAIYGSSNMKGVSISGRYAGYFNGDTHVKGTLTATALVTPSDSRLKANIESFNDEDGVLEKVQNLNVVSYNYVNNRNSQESIDLLTGETSADANTSAITNSGEDSRKHYGLLAQELQRIYPELVHKGQDGYLGINYVELVPILIRSIQELKAELDEVKGNSSRMEARSASLEEETTDVLSSTIHRNVLYQNTPNPFKEQTVIRFKLADNVQNASICIFDMTGKMLKKLPISSDMESVSIGGYELGEGMFIYSLVVNGKEIDTKKMIITK